MEKYEGSEKHEKVEAAHGKMQPVYAGKHCPGSFDDCNQPDVSVVCVSG